VIVCRRKTNIEIRQSADSEFARRRSGYHEKKSSAKRREEITPDDRLTSASID
jgi:hypothetical protein